MPQDFTNQPNDTRKLSLAESPFVDELLAEMGEETEHPLPLEDDAD